jgi:hypothetical protein
MITDEHHRAKRSMAPSSIENGTETLLTALMVATAPRMSVKNIVSNSNRFSPPSVKFKSINMIGLAKKNNPSSAPPIVILLAIFSVPSCSTSKHAVQCIIEARDSSVQLISP